MSSLRSFLLLRVVLTRPMEAAPGRWLRDREQHRTVFGSYEDGRASTSSKSTKTMCSDRGRLRGGMDSSLFWRRRRKHSIWWLPMLAGAARARRRAGHRCGRAAAPPTRASARALTGSVVAGVGSGLRVWDRDHQCKCKRRASDLSSVSVGHGGRHANVAM